MKYIVYHGTNAKFNKFSTEYLGIGNDALGIGFYFAETTFQAEHYGKNLMKCEITLNKPIILQEGEKEIHQRDVELKMSLKQTIDILKKHPDIYNPDETPLWNIIDISGMDIEDAIEEVAMKYQGKYLSMNMDLFPSNDIEYREALRDVCGYDGILQHTPHGNIYVCWFPEQIKILETITEDLQDIYDYNWEAPFPFYYCKSNTIKKDTKITITKALFDDLSDTHLVYTFLQGLQADSVYNCQEFCNDKHLATLLRNNIENIVDYFSSKSKSENYQEKNPTFNVREIFEYMVNKTGDFIQGYRHTNIIYDANGWTL